MNHKNKGKKRHKENIFNSPESLKLCHIHNFSYELTIVLFSAIGAGLCSDSSSADLSSGSATRSAGPSPPSLTPSVAHDASAAPQLSETQPNRCVLPYQIYKVWVGSASHQEILTKVSETQPNRCVAIPNMKVWVGSANYQETLTKVSENKPNRSVAIPNI